MKTYLSIDMDYWDHWGADIQLASNGMESTITHMLETHQVPVQLFIDHEHMMPRIKELSASHILNIDFHDDVVDKKAAHNLILECGNWVTKLAVQKKTPYLDYTWIYPGETSLSEGRCDEDVELGEAEQASLKTWSLYCGGAFPYSVADSHDVCGIGICLSPEYWSYPNLMEKACRLWLRLASHHKSRGKTYVEKMVRQMEQDAF